MKNIRESLPVFLLTLLGFVYAAVSLSLVAAQKASQPKFKAIWEPVSYKEDLALFDIRFTSKEEGWVTRSAGTILHTTDGGTSWTAELGGDPHAQGGEIKLRIYEERKARLGSGMEHPIPHH
jgi:photosystem II stability/assembly factor-like uncharacterized protein